MSGRVLRLHRLPWRVTLRALALHSSIVLPGRARAAGAAAGVALTVLVVACDAAPAPVPACEGLGVRVEAASAADRRVLGVASDYPADGMLASRWEELVRSQRARRAAAWEVIARVVEPVALAEPVALPDATVPRFRTWYDSEDATRIFQSAYTSLSPAERMARARIAPAAIEAALVANLHVLDSMPAWDDTRWTAHLAGIDDPLETGALSGLRRIALSPDAVRHVVRSYPEILRCFLEGSPPAFVDGAPAPATLVREALALEACEVRVLGPYWVASGGTIEARLEGARASEGTLRLLTGATLADAAEVCVGPGDLGCDAAGPGAFFVEVRAAGRPLAASLVVTHAAPSVPVAACLDGVFPLASATVAQHWQRVELGPLPMYDTSGAAIAEHLAADATWGDGEGSADPGPDEIFTIRLPSGGTFRLAGMHIRTRELEHWMNITMWWTPTPDADFGADRPASFAAVGGPWSHYAMCVTIDDVERDPDPTGGFGTDAPTLAAALEAVSHEPSSWCSNPYIDAAPGLVRSNCVGCHQHAMSGVLPGETVMDEDRYPLAGRAFVRNNFPADQFWGLDAGDDLANVVADTVAYWDSAVPAP